MCRLFCTCCYYCCTTQASRSADSIAMNTLENIEKVLNKEILQRYDTSLLGYDIALNVAPKPGIVKEIIYKQQLLKGISLGLRQAKVSAWNISYNIEEAISNQLVGLLFRYMLTGEAKFDYNEKLTNSNYSAGKIHIPEDGRKRIRTTIRSIPTGSQVKLTPVEKLDLQIAQTVCAALKKLDIAQVTSTTFKKIYSEQREEEERQKKITTMSLEMNRI